MEMTAPGASAEPLLEKSFDDRRGRFSAGADPSKTYTVIVQSPGFRSNTAATLFVIDSIASQCGEGFLVGCTASTGYISNSAFVDNGTGVRNCSSSIYSSLNNTISGNTTEVDGLLIPSPVQ